MAVPKHRVSKARRNKRRAQNFKLTAPNLATCSKCGALVMPHRACRSCGTYKNKVVIETE